MNQKQLNKYCDEVLRILNKSNNDDPLLFGIGEFRKEHNEEEDLFVKIKVSEEDTTTIIHALENVYKYITTDAKEHTSYYDLEKKEYIKSALYAIKITDAGKYFIQTSSLYKEAKWKNINKWVPNLPGIISVTAVFISIIACAIFFNHIKKEKKELEKQKEEFSIMIKETAARQLLQMDSLLKKEHFDDSGFSAKNH
jgi:hypothetical protein